MKEIKMKQIQSLIPVRKFLSSYLKRNHNASLPTLFKNVREIESISYIGNWPILTEIINICAEKNKFFTKEQIVKVTKISSDPILKSQRTDSKLVAILSNREELISKVSASK
jgi:hypothetical protein